MCDGSIVEGNREELVVELFLSGYEERLIDSSFIIEGEPRGHVRKQANFPPFGS